MTKRRAAVFTGANRDLEIREYETTPPQPGQALLSLLYSGVCGTDVHIHQGRLGAPEQPFVIGHEFTGVIEALGSEGVDGVGQPLAVGDRAIACVAVPCGECFNCRRGETASCLAFGVTYTKPVADAPHFHGGYAEALYSPLANLVKLPDNVDARAAASFPCGGPTVIRSCAYGGELEDGELVVIQGNGSLGVFALAWAKAHGCRTIVIGGSSNRARLAAQEAIGCDLFLDRRQTTPEERRARVIEFAGKLGRGDGADVVIEVSGAADALPEGINLVRTRGRYLIPGQYSVRGTVAIRPELITFRALRLIGSGQYTMADIKAYLGFLGKHPDYQRIFADAVAVYPVAEANRALSDAARGKTLKAALVIEEGWK